MTLNSTEPLQLQTSVQAVALASDLANKDQEERLTHTHTHSL